MDYATHASTLSCRYLASSAAPEDPSNKPQGVASKEAERTGQADETGPSGKPIRRGVISVCRCLQWIDFICMNKFILLLRLFFFFIFFSIASLFSF